MRVAVLAFVAGILVLHVCASLPSAAWALLLIPLVLLAWRWPSTLPLLFFALGFFWAVFRADLVLREALPVAMEGRDLWVEGYVADLPHVGERGPRFRFHVERAWHDGAPISIPRRILLSSYDPRLAVHVGDKWGFAVRLKRPRGFQNPGGKDYEAYLFRERIRATGYIRDKDRRPQWIASERWSYPVGRLRERIGQAIASALPDHAFAGVLTAFANGDERGIDDAAWQVLMRSGTAHLIAISGMNIGLIAGIAFFLTRRLWALSARLCLRWPAPKAAALAGLAAGAFYAALAGFAIPTQRALIMLAVVMGSIVFGVRTMPSALLALALFLVLLHDPLAVMSPGFWLSFASVAVIALALAGTAPARWWRAGRLQLAVSIGLVPLLILLFQQVPLVSPLANLLAIPVVEIAVIPLTLLGVALLPVADSLAALAWRAAAEVMNILWPPLSFLAGFDQLQWTQAPPPWWAAGLAVIGILWLLAPRGWPVRAVGLVWLLPMLLVRPPTPKAGELSFTLLDVGQGLAAVVQTQNHVLVYDTGPRFSTRFDAGRAVVVPFLRARGIARVDRMIISHRDNDHAGGLSSVLAAVPVNEVFTAEPARLSRSQACIAGQTWEWDGVRFAMLSPWADEATNARRANDQGCVLRVMTAHGRLLLPADIEARRERLLVERTAPDLRADILVVPHHGSKSSSTAAFVEHVRPRYALFAAGYRNRYRHPHPEVLARYRDAGVQLYDSASAGAIQVSLGEAGIHVSAYRQAQKRYWFSD